jgi:hypothetical protein
VESVLTGCTCSNVITCYFRRWVLESSGETRSPNYALILCTACRGRTDCSHCLPSVGEHPTHQFLFCLETAAALSCLLYTSLTRSMMQINKQAKVMSNGYVMGRGPTDEVSRQTAFSHTYNCARQPEDKSVERAACLVCARSKNAIHLTWVWAGKSLSWLLTGSVFFGSCRVNLILVRVGRVFDVM